MSVWCNIQCGVFMVRLINSLSCRVQVYVLRLSPFYTAMGACLFTWNEDGRVLTKGPFQFRVVNSPMTAPDAYSSYQVRRTSVVQYWACLL
jgi:hypothetical protein